MVEEILPGSRKVQGNSYLVDLNNYTVTSESGALVSRIQGAGIVFENAGTRFNLSAGQLRGTFEGQSYDLASDCNQGLVDYYIREMELNN